MGYYNVLIIDIFLYTAYYNICILVYNISGFIVCFPFSYDC